MTVCTVEHNFPKSSDGACRATSLPWTFLRLLKKVQVEASQAGRAVRWQQSDRPRTVSVLIPVLPAGKSMSSVQASIFTKWEVVCRERSRSCGAALMCRLSNSHHAHLSFVISFHVPINHQGLAVQRVGAASSSQAPFPTFDSISNAQAASGWRPGKPVASKIRAQVEADRNLANAKSAAQGRALAAAVSRRSPAPQVGLTVSMRMPRHSHSFEFLFCPSATGLHQGCRVADSQWLSLETILSQRRGGLLVLCSDTRLPSGVKV